LRPSNQKVPLAIVNVLAELRYPGAYSRRRSPSGCLCIAAKQLKSLGFRKTP
jgi:hypothetical protein